MLPVSFQLWYNGVHEECSRTTITDSRRMVWCTRIAPSMTEGHGRSFGSCTPTDTGVPRSACP